jgi:transposase
LTLGFRHAARCGGAGQPPFDPADLLKLYLYGYLNQVCSSRRLEREAGRNVELIWLLRGLVPGYRTIAEFRKENRSALKAANSDFVLLARALDLLGGTLLAIDGAFFHGDASKASLTTRQRLVEQLANLERSIETYAGALDANDAEEAAQPDCAGGPGGEVAEKLAALLARGARTQADLAQLEASGQTQLSRTDADARLLTKPGQVVAGYNVQVAVDDKHEPIVASEVVNDDNDTGQLHVVAVAAKAALGAETLTALADVGYYNGETLKACEADGITAYVPPAERGRRLSAQGRFRRADFSYDAADDVYRCPQGGRLRRMSGGKLDATGKWQIRYATRRSDCRACPLRGGCLTRKSHRRTVERWVHEDVIERHLARMQGAATLMRRRAALAEHPFGTLKCRAGYRHFLLRGFDKVRGEWSLLALCYNFTRVLNILGLDRFRAYLARRPGLSLFPPGWAIEAATCRLIRVFIAIRNAITPKASTHRACPQPAL